MSRSTSICLGAAQLISWGTTYYLIGAFGEQIASSTGWSRSFVYGGFSIGLMVMGVASPLAGHLIDRYSAQRVLSTGSVLNAVGCASLALSHHPIFYCLAWVVLGVSMRLTLYDAVFAALARIKGADARHSMAQVTVFGGLASTTFWPLGNMLTSWVGWRGSLLVYAAIALTAIPLYSVLSAPPVRQDHRDLSDPVHRPALSVEYDRVSGWLYSAIMAIVGFLNSGMSAHMIDLLAGLGLGAAPAIWLASLRGLGQTTARAGETIFLRQVSPLAVNLIAASFLVGGFSILPVFGVGMFPAMLFALAFGAGNGLASIARGTVPLVLFDASGYGSVTGRLLIPSFVLSAAGPVVLDGILQACGAHAVLLLVLSLSALLFCLCWLCSLSWRRRNRGSSRSR